MTIVCDFCSSPDVRWRYRSPDSRSTAVGINPETSQSVVIDANFAGDWAACPVCHALIEEGNRDRLARRSARRLVRKHPRLSMANALMCVRQPHDVFFATRTDTPPIPHTPEDT